MLLEAKLSMAEVADRVGYAHQSNFAAAFSGHMGMSPREYRRHRGAVHVSIGAVEAEMRDATGRADASGPVVVGWVPRGNGER